MSRTDKDRPYEVRCKDPREDREWHHGGFRRRWVKVPTDDAYRADYYRRFGCEYKRATRWKADGWHYEDGRYYLRQKHCNCDDWCLDGRTRWRYGRVSKPRTTRSMARQRLRAIDPYYEDPEDYTGRWESHWDLSDDYDEDWSWLSSNWASKGYWSYHDPRLDEETFWAICTSLEASLWEEWD